MGRIIPWLVFGGLLILGLYSIWLALVDDFFEPVPKNELTLVEGIAADVRTSKASRTYFVYFSVGSESLEYASDQQNFSGVLAAVADGERLRIRGSKKTLEPLFGRAREKFEIYTITVGNTEIVKYSDMVAFKSHGATVCLIFGFACLGIITISVWAAMRRGAVKFVDQSTLYADDASVSPEALEMLKAAEQGGLREVPPT